jgi:hypothetical protein
MKLNMIQLNRRLNMPVNQNETNLQAITVTIAHLEKQEDKDEEMLKKLKYERQSILKQMNLI